MAIFFVLATSYCWCVNEGGKPVPGSSVRYARPACRPTPDSARYRRGRGEARSRGRTNHKEAICTQADRYGQC